MCRARALVAERWEKFYKPGMPYADRVVIVDHGRSAGARRRVPQQGDRHCRCSGPAQYVAYREDPNLKNGILEVAEVFTRHMGMNLDQQAVHRQARAPGDQSRDRHRSDHQASGEGQGLPRDELAAADLARLRQDAASPMPSIPSKAKQLLAEAGYPNGFEFEWTTSQNESWGLPIVEAVIPMLAKVGIKVKVKQVEVAVLVETCAQG